jgi:hypothetical protein
MKPRRIATERLDTILKEATEVDDNAFVKANRSNTGEKLAPRDKYASDHRQYLDAVRVRESLDPNVRRFSILQQVSVDPVQIAFIGFARLQTAKRSHEADVRVERLLYDYQEEGFDRIALRALTKYAHEDLERRTVTTRVQERAAGADEKIAMLRSLGFVATSIENVGMRQYNHEQDFSVQFSAVENKLVVPS